MVKKTISIIIPTWNEEENIESLIKEIVYVMRTRRILYEVIFVDDHSTDNTIKKISTYKKTYPIRVFKKKGTQGKAQSLVEGISYAKYPTVCMIDADLQYPPAAIPEMLKKIYAGSDIVVAERTNYQIGFIRKLTSKGYNTVFSKLLHQLHFDTQSGLKVFKKEVFELLDLHPNKWAIDMEFLLKAKRAGYKITSTPITFHERKRGKAKISILSASLQLALNALSLKFITDTPLLINKNSRRMKGKGVRFKGVDFIHHTSLPHKESALYTITSTQKMVVASILGIVVLSLLIDWHTSLFIFVATITTLYFLDLLFNLFLIFRSFSKSPEIVIKDSDLKKIPDSEWPMYTIYCPLYKEWNVVPQFINAISKLDYPKEKLQVLLLLEDDDKETIEQINKFLLPSFIQTVVVPHSMPKTKPKALNYGLTKTQGDYVVIYDAEDIPDPLQLKKAILAFKRSGEKTICIQAKLNFYNPTQNMLTRIFTAEYSLWFDLVLTGLQSIKAPIPLGGTSNHFRTKDIRTLHGWDAFNVTEDCDLGTRLAKRGFHTAIIDSTTFEEANSDLKNWYHQRSRWIKGYIQTYFVHMRDPKTFFTYKKTDLITFQLVVGAKIFSLFVNPFMWLSTILYFALRPFLGEFIESFFPAPVLYMAVFALVVGNFLYVYYYMIGLAKRGYEELIPFVFLVPFYWLLMSFASWKALYEFITRPHYWAKTRHGLHLTEQGTVDTVPGNSLIDRRVPIEISPAFPK